MTPAVILAAGASSRMGRTKALLPTPDGRTFLERLAGTFLAAGAAPVLAVVGLDGPSVRRSIERTRLPIEFVENPDPSRGQLSSLQAALSILEGRDAEAVLFTPVDHPLIEAGTVRSILDAWRRTRAPVVRPSRQGRHGHPVLVDRSLFQELRSGDLAAGARPIIQAHRDLIVDVAIDLAGGFEDIDTPADYRRIFGFDLPGNLDAQS